MERHLDKPLAAEAPVETPEVVETPGESVNEAQDQPEVEKVEEVEKEVQQAAAPTKDDNLRILRERYERAEYERDKAIQQAKELQSKYQQPNENKKVEEGAEDLNFDPDELAEGKHLTKVVNKIKRLEKKLEEAQQKTQNTTTELKIKRDFPDFEKVATFENLKKLRDTDPDLADAILSTPDPYKQHALAYKMVKQMGIYVEDKYNKERELANKNSSKPRPLTSISPQQGDTPLSKANAFAGGLTDELKAQLRKEMVDAIKGH